MDSANPEPRRGAPLGFWLATLAISGLMFFSAMWRHYTMLTAPPPAAQVSSTTLVASPDDPQMHEAIKEAQADVRSKGGGNAWSKPHEGETTVTIQTVGGPLQLSPAEVAEANEIYPHLVVRSKSSDFEIRAQDGPSQQDQD